MSPGLGRGASRDDDDQKTRWAGAKHLVGSPKHTEKNNSLHMPREPRRI